MALKTIQVVGAAIILEGRCLAAQRSADMSLPLKWEFPGGKVEPGETSESALAREIAEELGVRVEVGARLGQGRAGLPDGREVVLDVYLAALLDEPDAIVLREHARWRWVEAHELNSLDWAQADIPVLEPLKRHLNRLSGGAAETDGGLR